MQVASQRLNCSFASSSPADDLDPGLRELCSINTYVMQLDQLCAGPSSTLESGKLIANALATMSLSEIGEMSVDDRVSLILGPSSDPSVVLSKFRNGSMFLALGEQSDEQRERMIDSSVLIYCGNAIMNSVGENKTSAEPQQVIALRNALDVCTEIANASRTTIRRSNRIVKDKCTLMNLVLGAAYGTSRACKNIDLSSSDCRHMVESIWESYECLPARSSPRTKGCKVKFKIEWIVSTRILLLLMCSPAGRPLLSACWVISIRLEVESKVMLERLKSVSLSLLKYVVHFAVESRAELLSALN